MRRTWLVALAFALAAGCTRGGGDDPPAPGPAPEPEPALDAALEPEPDVPPIPDAAPPAFVEIGGGARRFEALTSGQEVPIIQGPQGGFHVWGGFRGRGFPDDEVRIFFELDLDGEVIANADYTEFELPVDSTGLFSYAAVAVIWFENDRVEPTSGNPMTLTVTVTASDGQTLSDSTRIVPICCER